MRRGDLQNALRGASRKRLARSERVLQLSLAHPRSPFDVSPLGFGVKLLTCVSVKFPGAGNSCPMTARGLFARVAATHGPGALALAVGADVRLALALLLCGAALGFLALGLAQIPPVAALAVVSRVAGLAQRDCNGLSAAPDLAALAAATALQFAVLELMH